MKCIKALYPLAALGLAACGSLSRPLDGTDFDPLRAPGNFNKPTESGASGFTAGKFVHAAIENTAFFNQRPKENADADKLLKQGTSMKVISTSGSYVKVELDSGEVGFVPSVMLEDSAVWQDVSLPQPGDAIVEPLPIIDPSGLPPEGSIPQVIDPESPVVETPLPPVTPSGNTFPAPKPQTTVKPKDH